jgi:glycosyltransferase involved in cell wall biosynthesis
MTDSPANIHTLRRQAAPLSDVCFFTIVSNNYLHYANTLFASLKQHCPQADLVLGLCDRPHAETACADAVDIVTIDELGIDDLATFAYQYSILELNTAIKPYLAEKLMLRGYRKVIYFDPDIRIYNSLDNMLGLLEQHNVLLTPHLTGPLDDQRWPSELSILQAGSYNLGFIALRAGDEALKLLRWWQAKLYKDCVVDLPRNLFVDQKWMDLAPSLFDGVFIQRDPGWNLAYWNLNHRPLLQVADGRFMVSGQPLTFFHFSGYSINDSTLSKHQNRFDKGAPGSALRALCDDYSQALQAHGIQRYSQLPYAFEQFADGTPVPDGARRLIRTDRALAGIDLFDKADCEKLHLLLNRPLTPHHGGLPLTELAHSLWASRKDLHDAFPAINSVDSQRFAEWLLDSAGREAGFSECYLQPIRQTLVQSQSAPTAASPLQQMLRLIWRQRRRVPVGWRIALQPYASKLLKRAYPQPQTPAIARSNELGVNLIGYLHAESGIGEAARSSLRALRHAGLPHALVDYRLGNVSRMEESPGLASSQSHFPINLMHVNADQSLIARRFLGQELFDQRYTMGYWYWEMPTFPSRLHFAYAQVDEVVVASEYNRKSITASTDKPVTLIPPAIEVRLEPLLSRDQLGLPEQAFIFLHISDALSVPQRKNPLGVVQAFQTAFPADAGVCLVLKLSNLEQQPELTEKIRAAANLDSRIHLIDGYLHRNQLNNLLNACNCYVSLHRAEGFGLPIAEAMYLGKPVIATYWSGNTDFMNERNSLPVDFSLVELQEDIGPYAKGQCWAEPDLQQAAQLMQHIASDTELSAKIGTAAAATIRQLYSPAVIAGQLNSRLQQIAELLP